MYPIPKRVLLVEDEVLNSKALTRYFHTFGIELTSVPSTEIAFRVLAQQPPYHAIITDLLLPGISGQEFARRLRQPRLIALSGDAIALRSGQLFDVKLRKPCPPDLLIGAVLGEEPGDAG